MKITEQFFEDIYNLSHLREETADTYYDFIKKYLLERWNYLDNRNPEKNHSGFYANIDNDEMDKVNTHRIISEVKRKDTQFSRFDYFEGKSDGDFIKKLNTKVSSLTNTKDTDGNPMAYDVFGAGWRMAVSDLKMFVNDYISKISSIVLKTNVNGKPVISFKTDTAFDVDARREVMKTIEAELSKKSK